VIQLDGWYCTNETPDKRQCGTWNGTEKDRKDRKECRSCGGPKTAPEGLTREDLFRLCALMVRERNAAVENLGAVQEKLIECAQAAKTFVYAGKALGTVDINLDSVQPVAAAVTALTIVVRRLEEDPATAAAMKRPYEPSPQPPEKCTGTLVHDEFTICPVHDRHGIVSGGIPFEKAVEAIPRCPRCYGTGLVTAGGVSVDCPGCAVTNAAAKTAADRGFASLREEVLEREREALKDPGGWDPAAPAGARRL
jgi:hypothetical protein